MRERVQYQKRLFIYSLRRIRRQSSPADQQLIQLCLIDRSVRQMVYEEAMEQLANGGTNAAGFNISRTADGTPIVDNLLKLLDWFVNNGPAIVEIIKLIAALFGGLAETSAILREEFEASDEVIAEL